MATLEEQLAEMALWVVRGRSLDVIQLYGLAGVIEINQFKTGFLPGPKTISGSPSSRKAEIFRLTSVLWGVSPERWLEMEQGWLESARAKSGSKAEKGKDKLDDVISAEILIRLMATIHFIDSLDKENYVGTKQVRRVVMNSLNMTLTEAILKGQTRIERYGDKSIYAHLKNAGIMIGTGGGKYLPDPETSLPYLFQMLQRARISDEAYF